MKDTLTLSWVNMFGILGALEDLCALSPEAHALIQDSALPGKRPLRLGFAVKDGPAMTLSFAGGVCKAEEGCGPVDIKLPFSTPEKFNGMIDGTSTPFPSRGFTKLGFLTGAFVKLTKILETYLRPEKAALEDPVFFEAGTTVMLFLIVNALAQIGNHDPIGQFTASNIVDGTVALSIAGGPRGALVIKDHRLTATRVIPEHYHALMEFADMKLARALFDGQVSALACVGRGLITMKGNLGMLDNVNRLLDRAAVYLA
ncbi:MAG: hypothetical protein LBR23_05260 [Spirochaetaceae bacterium]|jgi:hypothetical protein|nr:hypothetical protein [Spirochaetaceae bacterium]